MTSRTRQAEEHADANATSAPTAIDSSTNHLVQISAQGEFELEPDEDLPVHQAATFFPVLPDQLEEMVESLRTTGQTECVCVFEDKILDGQKRNIAQKRLGFPLKCRRFADLGGLTPFEWSVRKNMAAGTARHLTDSQRALIGARLCRDVYEPEAAKRMRTGQTLSDEDSGRACEKAAKAVNVKTNRLRQALKVTDAEIKALEDAVWTSELVISNAARIAELTSDRDRKRALAAAKNKDTTTLREILRGDVLCKDARGEPIMPQMRSVFRATSAWDKQLMSLRRVCQWMKDSGGKPEARVLKEQLDLHIIESLLDTFATSKPWCQCPYCTFVEGNECPVCQGSGWLTKSEYEANKAASDESYVHQIEQRKAVER